MNDTIVSVIIPTYNREKLIIKAIDSVLRQTYQDFEILIIDDASTDNTGKVISDLNNDKIKYYKLDKNSGQCVARNFGIKKSNAKYIAFLDSDDEWLPEKLRLQIDCFEKGTDKLGGVYGYSYQKDVIKNETTLVKDEYYRGNIHDKFLEGFCPPTPSIFLIKNEALQKLHGFDENLITFVDLDMWLRISEEYEFDYVEEPIIIKYEQIGDQYVNNFVKRNNGYKLFIKKWQDYIKGKKGKTAFSKFKTHLSYAVIIPILEHPPRNIRPQILKIIGILIKIRSTRLNLYLKSIMILFFGANIVSTIRKIRS
jgi:glycosyltransferase involved in cell wall biosynthesis